jgi:hypothetical protein
MPPPAAAIATSTRSPTNGAPSAPVAFASGRASDADADLDPRPEPDAIRGATESGNGIGCEWVLAAVAMGTSGVVEFQDGSSYGGVGTALAPTDGGAGAAPPSLRVCGRAPATSVQRVVVRLDAAPAAAPTA